MKKSKRFYNYHDDDKGISFKIPVFKVEKEDDIFIHFKSEMMDAIVKAAERMLVHEYDSIPCFILIDSICNITKKTIYDNLDKAEEYYKEQEMYETCEDIIKLKQQL
tara:strand:+ start:2177 stop:2497 length:321 start_codon:yes stop_codon:yes gene_type:complete